MTDTVILLHGLCRTKFSMSYLGYQLQKHGQFHGHGFKVLNFGYNSRKENITYHAQALEKFLKNHTRKEDKINFVTHSLGSLVVRVFAEEFHSDFSLHRAVMLGPPNQGADIARFLQKYNPARSIFGPILSQIATLNIPHATDKIEIGVIAGGRNKDKSLVPILKGDNDGVVRVEETYLPGIKDHILLPALHSFLMYQPLVIKQTLHFLKNGRFQQ
jgi:triacylglycerol lipase